MTKKPKLLFTFGTRPEAIKMAPVVNTFILDDSFCVKIVLTAQHREMLDQVLSIFGISGDYDFNIMVERQSLEFVTTEVLNRFSDVIKYEKPDLVFVHGDTTTTFAGALASFYQNVPVAHVEAGLRSWDLRNPFPEEMNRKLTDSLCNFHFCPTKIAKENLLKESVLSRGIYITGNTVVDALENIISKIDNDGNSYKDSQSSKIILLTMHRRESLGEPMREVMEAIKDVLVENNGFKLVFPVHKNPAVREIVYPIFEGIDRVELIEPLDYFSFIKLMNQAYLIISDSGGIQEEAPTLRKPVLLTRKITERPEGIESGVVKIIGTDYKDVKDGLTRVLNDNSYYESMVKGKNPFGDGLASKRILKFTKEFFDLPLSSKELINLREFC